MRRKLDQIERLFRGLKVLLAFALIVEALG